MVSPESVKHKEPEKGGGTMVDLFIVMVDVKLYAFNDVKLLFYIHIYIYVYVCLFLPWPTLAPKVNQWTRDWQGKGGNHRKPILISCLNNGEQTQTTIPINIDPEWRVVLQQPELSVYSDSLSKWSQF